MLFEIIKIYNYYRYIYTKESRNQSVFLLRNILSLLYKILVSFYENNWVSLSQTFWRLVGIAQHTRFNYSLTMFNASLTSTIAGVFQQKPRLTLFNWKLSADRIWQCSPVNEISK